MQLSYELVRDWAWYCSEMSGRMLPMNCMYLSDEGSIRLGYEVPDGEPAVLLVTGMAARQIMLDISVDDIALDDIN